MNKNGKQRLKLAQKHKKSGRAFEFEVSTPSGSYRKVVNLQVCPRKSPVGHGKVANKNSNRKESDDRQNRAVENEEIQKIKNNRPENIN